MKGILGRKVGMTQVFTNSGELVPVTVVSVEPNVVTQIKTKENDGYEAIQLGFETKREKLANKPSIGHTNKANTKPKRFFKEIRGVDVSNYTLGQEVKADIFVEGEVIDVTGTTKGKGFQGAIKRHNQTRGPMTHGSQYHRGVGSMGSRLPKRVMKGKKLPGHMGAVTVTIQNLEIIAVDLENNALLVKGNIPGPKKGLILVRSSVKNPGVINEFDGLISYDQALVETYDEIVNENPELVEEETPMAEVNAEVEVENEKEEA